jgi:hypothetical protein
LVTDEGFGLEVDGKRVKLHDDFVQNSRKTYAQAPRMTDSEYLFLGKPLGYDCTAQTGPHASLSTEKEDNPENGRYCLLEMSFVNIPLAVFVIVMGMGMQENRCCAFMT